MIDLNIGWFDTKGNQSPSSQLKNRSDRSTVTLETLEAEWIASSHPSDWDDFGLTSGRTNNFPSKKNAGCSSRVRVGGSQIYRGTHGHFRLVNDGGNSYQFGFQYLIWSYIWPTPSLSKWGCDMMWSANTLVYTSGFTCFSHAPRCGWWCTSEVNTWLKMIENHILYIYMYIYICIYIYTYLRHFQIGIMSVYICHILCKV